MDEKILLQVRTCYSQNAENAFVALKESLYIDTGHSLFKKLLRVIRGNPISFNDVGVEVILKHDDNGKAIGVASYDPYDMSGYANIQVYVSPEHRLKGIGKQLVNEFKERFPEDNYNVGIGDDDSGKFWCNIGMDKDIFNTKHINEMGRNKNKTNSKLK